VKPIKNWEDMEEPNQSRTETEKLRLCREIKGANCRIQNKTTHTICWTWLTTGSSRERGNEGGREGKKRRELELPMMQAESRMVPSEGRSHTRLQQALHCVYPPAANVASTTTNYYSQVKGLTQWTFWKTKSPFSFTSNCRNPQ
jgi:hypothetical protein